MDEVKDAKSIHEKVYEMDGARHCFKCRQTWHERNGKWDPEPSTCIEKLTEVESWKQRALRAEAELKKHEGCITPCDSIRIQEQNHNLYLEMKDRAETAEAKLKDALIRAEAAERCSGRWLKEWDEMRADRNTAEIKFKGAMEKLAENVCGYCWRKMHKQES